MGFLGILRKVKQARRRRRRATKVDHHYISHKERARALVHERLTHWNQFYNLSYNRVAIRNQGTRWGSCSSKQNLNFNYRLIFIAPELVDYVVVHELCHLAHFNHGKEFWNLVGEAVPDYEDKVRMLRAVTQKIAVQGIQSRESTVHSPV